MRELVYPSFLEDRNRIEIMGYNARKHAEKYFDINKVINTHLQIYNNKFNLKIC